ncbi:hypothetical protein ILP97_12710 [Amycolatopsis sp. H6(2020)]|nr:hypothetical protein [Amycolatopsis sp. H6(2020)]
MSQGAAAAFMSPTALPIVTTTFTDNTERSKALGIWAGTAGFGASGGGTSTRPVRPRSPSR